VEELADGFSPSRIPMLADAAAAASGAGLATKVAVLDDEHDAPTSPGELALVDWRGGDDDPAVYHDPDEGTAASGLALWPK